MGLRMSSPNDGRRPSRSVKAASRPRVALQSSRLRGAIGGMASKGRPPRASQPLPAQVCCDSCCIRKHVHLSGGNKYAEVLNLSVASGMPLRSSSCFFTVCRPRSAYRHNVKMLLLTHLSTMICTIFLLQRRRRGQRMLQGLRSVSKWRRSCLCLESWRSRCGRCCMRWPCVGKTLLLCVFTHAS